MNRREQQRGRIFIIDDDEVAVEGMKALFESEGYEVASSASALTSFELRRFNPDVVLLDLTLPGLSGEGLLSIGRRRTFPDAAQIILHSGRSRAELAVIAERTGVDGFHSKGDDLEGFLLRMRRWVRCGQARNAYLDLKRTA